MRTLIYGLIVGACASLGWAQQGTATIQKAETGKHPYSPFMLSLADPMQVPPHDFDIGGLRISILFGQCRNFDGLDLGLAGRATGHANGLQSCAVNVVDGDGMGLQANWLAGYVSGEYAGFQVGTVNYAEKAQALQIGFYNGAGFIRGCQIGAINIAQEMIGLQIGVVNVIQNKDVPFIPIVNGYF